MPADFTRLKEAIATRYALIRELGSGGMATVYLAQDLRHHRNVAVKVLRPDLAATLGSDRFFREIEVAARLQHPHILPLLDSGEAAGFYYYVMPFVQGESLRERLDKHGELPIPEAVRILREVVDALAEAHSNGVVHRDIKPDNVMLSGRHALVTDFGVAKAVSEATGAHQLTTAGVALGTPTYMAPEQATADPTLDHRVDIYATGILGYEMLTGTPPFTGRTAQEVLAAQVTQQPIPITQRRSAVSPILAEVVMKCLEKHAADRWQTAAALLEQLETLSTPSTGMTPTQTRPLTAVKARRSMPRWLGWTLGGAVVAAGAFALSMQQTPPRTLALGSRTVVGSGPEWDIHPSISPDGRIVSYTSVDLGTPRIVVQQVDGGNPVVVSTGGFGSAFSPDGTRLLVHTPRGLEIMPALGGQSRVIALTDGWGNWSPDGRTIVYPRGDTLFVQHADSSRARAIVTGRDLHSPAWSSDGRWIAYVEGNSLYHREGNLGANAIRVVPAEGGAPVNVTTEPVLNTSPVWVPGRRTLLFVSDREGGRDIYQVELTSGGAPRGPAVRITTGLDAEWISLSADGTRLTWSQFREYANIWSLPIEHRDSVPMSQATQVTAGTQNIESLSFSPDGEWLYFDADRGGNSDIYRRRLEGGQTERLTTDPSPDFVPQVSPDGRELAFHSLRTGNRDVFVMPAAGGEPVRVTTSAEQDYNPTWSRDGQRLMFDQQRSDRGLLSIERQPNGQWGDPVPVPGVGRAGRARWSPDGQWVSYISPDGVHVLNAASGQSRLVVAIPDGRFPSSWSAWSPDSRTIYLTRTDSLGVFRVVAISLDGRPMTTVAFADIPGRQLHRHGIAVSRGRLYFPLLERNSDVWVANLH